MSHFLIFILKFGFKKYIIKFIFFLLKCFCFSKKKQVCFMGDPLQCSCLENPRDGGAWWAAISGVAEWNTTEAT